MTDQWKEALAAVEQERDDLQDRLNRAMEENDRLGKQIKATEAMVFEFAESSIAACRAWDEPRLYKLWFSNEVRRIHRGRKEQVTTGDCTT